MTCDHCNRSIDKPAWVIERGFPRVRVHLCADCMMKRPSANLLCSTVAGIPNHRKSRKKKAA
jgi:hypothetical protein